MARRSKQQRLLEEKLAYHISMLAVDLNTALEGMDACTRLLDGLGDGYELPEKIVDRLLKLSDKMLELIDKV